MDRGRSAQRGPDERKGLIDLRDNRLKIGDPVVEGIGAGFGPFALPMAAQVDVDHPVTPIRKRLGGALPAVARLPASVEQDHHRRIERPQIIDGEHQPIVRGNPVQPRRASFGSGTGGIMAHYATLSIELL